MSAGLPNGFVKRVDHGGEGFRCQCIHRDGAHPAASCMLFVSRISLSCPVKSDQAFDDLTRAVRLERLADLFHQEGMVTNCEALSCPRVSIGTAAPELRVHASGRPLMHDQIEIRAVGFAQSSRRGEHT